MRQKHAEACRLAVALPLPASGAITATSTGAVLVKHAMQLAYIQQDTDRVAAVHCSLLQPKAISP